MKCRFLFHRLLLLLLLLAVVVVVLHAVAVVAESAAAAVFVVVVVGILSHSRIDSSNIEPTAASATVQYSGNSTFDVMLFSLSVYTMCVHYLVYITPFPLRPIFKHHH